MIKDNNSSKKPSPFDLGTGDLPGNLITQVELRGENYEEWSRAMRTSLRARRNWGFIEGLVKKPASGNRKMVDCSIHVDIMDHEYHRTKPEIDCVIL